MAAGRRAASSWSITRCKSQDPFSSIQGFPLRALDRCEAGRRQLVGLVWSRELAIGCCSWFDSVMDHSLSAKVLLAIIASCCCSLHLQVSISLYYVLITEKYYFVHHFYLTLFCEPLFPVFRNISLQEADVPEGVTHLKGS